MMMTISLSLKGTFPSIYLFPVLTLKIGFPSPASLTAAVGPLRDRQMLL